MAWAASCAELMKKMALEALSLIICGLEEEATGRRSEKVRDTRSSITARPKKNIQSVP